MLPDVELHSALGFIEDTVYVLTDRGGFRPVLKNEKPPEENAFIQFVNAQNVWELLSATDALVEQYPDTPLVMDLVGYGDVPSVKGADAEQVAKLFEPNPTPSTIERTRSAIGAWSVEGTYAGSRSSISMPDGSQMPLYFPLPLTDLVQAQQDLRRHSLLLAWLEDKATFEQAHGLTAGDKAARVHTLDLTGSTEKDNPSALPRYYAELAGRVDNEQDAFNVRCIATVPQLHLYGDTEQVRKEAASYVSSAFSLLLSDEKNGMGSDLVPAVRPATILCAAWSYMARGLTNQGAPDSIGVCSHCGKFFLRRRTTKQYCSSSCRTMAQRIASQSR